MNDSFKEGQMHLENGVESDFRSSAKASLRRGHLIRSQNDEEGPVWRKSEKSVSQAGVCRV